MTGFGPSATPHEPDSFAKTVATHIKELRPNLHISIMSPQALLVDGMLLDLHDLHRMVSELPNRSSEIINLYLQELFKDKEQILDLASLSFDFARPIIRPRIRPEPASEDLNSHNEVHVSFVNGTRITYVLDLPTMLVSITSELLESWGKDVETLDEVARENLALLEPDTPFHMVRTHDGGKFILMSHNDSHDAARLLLPGLHQRLAPHLGEIFLAAIPTRDILRVLSHEPGPFVERMRGCVEDEYSKLPYPISPHFFYMTPDGIADGACRLSWD